MKSARIISAGLCISVLVAALIAPPLHAAPVRITVQVDKEIARVSPQLFGQNYGPLSSDAPEYVTFYKAAGVSLLRFPQGNYGDDNEIYHNQLDDLAVLSKTLNAPAVLQVRSWRLGTAQKAAEMVRYCNVEKGYAFPYWEIGNEPNLYMKRRNQPGDPVFDVNWYNAHFREFSAAMKAVDPKIKIAGPVVDQNGYDWLPQFFKANGDIVDVISWHWYPEGDQLSDEAVLATPKNVESQVKNIRTWWADPTVNPLGFKRPIPPLLLSEYSISWASDTSRHLGSQVRALWTAEVLGRMANLGVDMAAHFAIQGVSWQGLVDRLKQPRPVFGAFQLYTHWGATQLTASSSDEALLPAFASRRADGSLALLVINKHPDTERTVSLDLQGFRPSGPVQVWQLTSAQPVAVSAAAIETQNLNSLSLPPYSITLLLIPPDTTFWIPWAAGGGGILLLGLVAAAIFILRRRK